MKFTKMCGAGNDFIVIENFDGALSHEELPLLARRLCRRHFSVGADGLLPNSSRISSSVNSGIAGSAGTEVFTCSGLRCLIEIILSA